MQIEKIIKKNNYYILVLSNGERIKTYEDVIIKNNILYKKSINSKILKKIEDDSKFYKVYNNVLTLINKRFRSEYEIKKYLEKYKVDKKIEEDIITKLKEINLINDYNYAKMYVNDKINLSLDGPYKIRKHLEQNKINSEIINQVINNIDETIIDAHIKKVIEKKVKSSTKYSESVYKQKLILYLVNLGYSKEKAKYFTENIKVNTNDKEFERVYSILLKKYTNSELKTNFILKMLAKGYKKDEINKFLDNKNL